jgi:hypothetical protein
MSSLKTLVSRLRVSDLRLRGARQFFVTPWYGGGFNTDGPLWAHDHAIEPLRHRAVHDALLNLDGERRSR